LACGNLVLRKIAKKTCGGLTKLRLLRGLLTNRLTGLHTTLLLLLKRGHRIGLRLVIALV
jgi:hypothetical protein